MRTPTPLSLDDHVWAEAIGDAVAVAVAVAVATTVGVVAMLISRKCCARVIWRQGM